MSSPAVTACRNCGTPAGGKFCSECGQTTAMHPPTAREFLQELLENQVALNGAIWKTLRKLAVPGQLTLEYFAGRRRRYVPPLRLYLTASLVFFLATKIFAPPPELIQLKTSIRGPGQGATISEACKDESICVQMDGLIRSNHGELTMEQSAKLVREKLLMDGPYAMFLLLPVFALLTRVAYWRRPRNYGEHLVLALHIHSFAFFAGAIVAPLHVVDAFTIPAFIYAGAALKHVFDGRWIPFLLRFLFISVSYFIAVTITLSAIAMAAILL